MKKKQKLVWAGVVVALVGTGATVYALRREDPDAGYRKQLRDFAAARTPGDRFRIAVNLPRASVLSKLPSKRYERFTVAEKSAAVEADAFVARIDAKAARFEAALRPKEVREIVVEDPRSLMRAAGFFTSAARRRLNCTKEEYARLKAKVPLEELFDRGMLVATLATLYDERRLPESMERAAAFAKGRAPAEYAELAETHYPVRAELFRARLAALEDRRAKYEKALAETGVPAAEVPDYAFKTATKSAPCLGTVATPLWGWIKEDATRARGASLLKKLEAHWRKNRELPRALSALPPDEKLGPGKRGRDGWYGEFRMRIAAGRVALVSLGPDREDGTEDDLVLGSFLMK